VLVDWYDQVSIPVFQVHGASTGLASLYDSIVNLTYKYIGRTRAYVHIMTPSNSLLTNSRLPQKRDMRVTALPLKLAQILNPTALALLFESQFLIQSLCGIEARCVEIDELAFRICLRGAPVDERRG
jgi:hypothetical protein